MDIRATLLAEINAYLKRTGTNRTAFGREAVGDGKLIPRLEAGQDIGLSKIQRIKAFIAKEPESGVAA